MSKDRFNKFKKSNFWSIFGPFSQFFGQQFFFTENLALSRTISYGFLAPWQKVEKTKDEIPRKRPDGRKDGWKDEGRVDPISKDPSSYRRGSKCRITVIEDL